MSKNIIISKPITTTVGEPKALPVNLRSINNPAANEPAPATIAIYQTLANDAEALGFHSGSVVFLVTADLKRHEAFMPRNWGIVSAVYRYRPTYEAVFKPIEVVWCRSGSVTKHLSEDLILINEAPSQQLLFMKIGQELNKESIKNVCPM